MKGKVLSFVLTFALAVLFVNAAFAKAGNEVTSSKPVTITMWVTANDQTPDNLAMEERFLAKYPNIKLNKILVNEQSSTDLQTAFAAGTNPDFAGTGAPQMSAYAYAGICAPLNDYFSHWADMKYIKKEIIDNYKIAGKYYGMPTYSYTMVLCYNKKIFKDAGLNPPATWDEWISTAKKLTVPAQQQWGMNMLVSYWTEWWFEYFVWMAGGDLTKQNADGTLTLTFTDPAVIKAAEFYRKMMAANAIQPDLSLDYGNLQKQFSLGHAAMTLYGSDGLHNFVGQGMNAEDVGYAELPVGPSGKRVSQIGGGVQFIFANTPKERADASWAWLTFKNTKEELETVLKYQASRGGADPQVLLRTDIDTSLGKINRELQAVVDRATKVSKLEFYGKGVIGSFVDKALETVLIDTNADIFKTFATQQELAKGEAQKFNEAVLASKKM